MNEDDVGKLFTINGKDVWQMTSYMESPSATFKNLVNGELVTGGIGSLVLNEFVRLKPENEDRENS